MVEAIKLLEMLNSICASFESYTEKQVYSFYKWYIQ